METSARAEDAVVIFHSFTSFFLRFITLASSLFHRGGAEWRRDYGMEGPGKTVKNEVAWLLKSLMIFWILNTVPGSMILFFGLLAFPPLGLVVLGYGIFAVVVLVGMRQGRDEGNSKTGHMLYLIGGPTTAFGAICNWLAPFQTT